MNERHWGRAALLLATVGLVLSNGAQAQENHLCSIQSRR